MMRVADIEHMVHRDVVITCTDGEVVRGRFASYQSFAEDPDEPECIYVRGWKYPIVQIDMDEIASIELA